LVLGPKGHISLKEFEKTVAIAQEVGFMPENVAGRRGAREKLLVKGGIARK
jgi:hypothetical protein